MKLSKFKARFLNQKPKPSTAIHYENNHAFSETVSFSSSKGFNPKIYDAASIKLFNKSLSDTNDFFSQRRSLGTEYFKKRRLLRKRYDEMNGPSEVVTPITSNQTTLREHPPLLS